jgi:hypothetical protein
VLVQRSNKDRQCPKLHQGPATCQEGRAVNLLRGYIAKLASGASARPRPESELLTPGLSLRVVSLAANLGSCQKSAAKEAPASDQEVGR